MKTSLFQEVKDLISLTLPIMLAQLANTTIALVDSIMAGNVSPLDLAAVSVGSSIWVIVILFINGVIMAVTPCVAQLRGSSQDKKIPIVVQHGLWIAITFSIFALLILQNYVHLFLLWMKVDPQVIPITLKYIYAISWGIPFVSILFTLRAYSEGLSHTRPILILAIISLPLNIIANYALVYGKFGLPKLGGPGCGWGTSFSMLVLLVVMIIYLKKDPILRSCNIFQTLIFPRIKELTKLLYIGLPIGISILVEVTSFAFVAIFISSISVEVVASHQIAMSFASFVFMVPLSIGIGTTIRIGHHIGQGKIQQVKTTCKAGIFIATMFAVCTSILIYLFSYEIASLYSKEQKVVEYAAELLIYAAFFQLSDALQVCILGCLRGYKDTQIPMCITFLAYWGIAMPAGYVLGMTNYWGKPIGANGFWIGLVGGLTIAAVLLGIRLLYVIKKNRNS